MVSEARYDRNFGPGYARLLRKQSDAGNSQWVGGGWDRGEIWFDPRPEPTDAERAAWRAQRLADIAAKEANPPQEIDASEAAQALRDAEREWNRYVDFLQANSENFSLAAVEIVAPVAPMAPPAVKREAAARVYGWLRDVSPSRASVQAGTGEAAYHNDITLQSEQAQYRPAMQGALRGSGALALLAPWIRRRAV